ncbi:MAG: cohesin domain-containing protein, partial [Bacteroidota bacterium]
GFQNLTAQSPLILGGYNVKTDENKEVCVQIYGRAFEQVLSMQYSLKWDTKILKYKGVKSFALPNLTTQNFGTQDVQKGILTFAWYDPKLQGINRTDGTALYEICFEAVGSSGTNTHIKFVNEPTVIEVSKAPGILIDLQTEGGKVEVLR